MTNGVKTERGGEAEEKEEEVRLGGQRVTSF